MAARTHLRLYEVESAQLWNDYHGDLNDREYSTAMADYHTVVGEYSEAIAIARHRLREDPSDVEAAILLGNAYRASRQFFLAEAAYVSALENLSCRGRSTAARNPPVAGQESSPAVLFNEAICELEEMLAVQPSDIATRLVLMETLIDAKSYAAAESLSNSLPRRRTTRSAGDAGRTGVFAVEAGTHCGSRRRIQALGRGSQWPSARRGLWTLPRRQLVAAT